MARAQYSEKRLRELRENIMSATSNANADNVKLDEPKTAGRRIGITGGRDFDDLELAESVLPLLQEGDVIVHGGAKGADTMFFMLAYTNGFKTEAHLADWNTHGKSAGPIRNQAMLDSGLDILISFPGGRGTNHMTSICEKAGVEVWRISREENA